MEFISNNLSKLFSNYKNIHSSKALDTKWLFSDTTSVGGKFLSNPVFNWKLFCAYTTSQLF